MDGVQYAAVSRNLAMGIGNFWFPVLSENSVGGLDTFHEHPPLGFFIQSFFFKVFGLHNIYPERIYALVVLVLTIVLIKRIWEKLFMANEPLINMWWLPVFLWCLCPVAGIVINYNLLEGTLTVFSLLSVYLFLQPLVSGSNKMNFVWVTTGALSVFLAFMVKGVPGLFTAVFFVCASLAGYYKSAWTSVRYTLYIALVLSLFFLLLYVDADSRESLSIWFHQRMVHRILNAPTTENRFHVVWGFFQETLVTWLVFFAVLLFKRSRWNGQQSPPSFNKAAMAFALTGAAGVIPLTFTYVQRNFYFAPAIPFFTLAVSVFSADSIQLLTQKIFEKRKVWLAVKTLSMLSFLVFLIVSVYLFKSPRGHEEILEDVYAIRNYVPAKSSLKVTDQLMWDNWTLRCYMVRYNDVSFTLAPSDTILSAINECPDGYISYKKFNTVSLCRLANQ